MQRSRGKSTIGSDDVEADSASATAHRFALEHQPVDPALRPFVTTIAVLRSDEGRIVDVLPAAVGYLTFMLSGTGSIRFATGRSDPVGPVVLLAPTSAAVSLDLEGPLFCVAGALSPLGWAVLTGLDAGQHGDQSSDGIALWRADAARLAERLRAMHAAKAEVRELVDQVLHFIQPRLQPIKPQHARLIAQIADWLSGDLNPGLAELQSATGYSGRQLQRLTIRYFGSGPKQLVRKYRALRVAALLQAEGTSDERAAGLVDLFYDQSHMIREIRRYLGRTPARLGREEGSLLSQASGLRNFREIRPNVARIPGD